MVKFFLLTVGMHGHIVVPFYKVWYDDDDNDNSDVDNVDDIYDDSDVNDDLHHHYCHHHFHQQHHYYLLSHLLSSLFIFRIPSTHLFDAQCLSSIVS
jgi:hypothetical protein